MSQNIENIVKKQRDFFAKGNSKLLHNRKVALTKLYRAIEKYEQEALEALNQDLGKSSTEGYLTELAMIYNEIEFALKNIDNWTAAKKIKAAPSQLPATISERAEPYGVVLIMAPWNYPIQLTLIPLVGALAAGNCCVLKPSNHAPRSSELIAKIIGEIFPPEYVAVVQGGREENQLLLEQRYDYIFFTGGEVVGKVVLEKAAANLTPVTLELGGKSPCIVDETANIEFAAKRIAYGKILNSGQTCIAPDYILVQNSVKQPLINWLMYYIEKQQGENPLENPDYPKIVNERHFDRLISLLPDSEDIYYGGKSDRKQRKIEPTLIAADLDSPAMQQEIFGPILPIISYDDISQAERIVLGFEKPLALYLFTRDEQTEQRILENISFGGGCINDTIVHMATTHVGFGGVGNSGMGRYHGKYSFDTFSHYKAVLRQSNAVDIPVRYPPYGNLKSKILKRILK